MTSSDRGISSIHLRDAERPTLTSLPKELLTLISSHLDTPSAIHLAITAKCFTIPAETRNWREVVLLLPPYSGGYPFVANITQKAAEDMRRLQAKRRTNDLLITGNHRRFGYVREATIETGPNGDHSLVQLLDFVHQRIKKLTIISSTLSYSKQSGCPYTIVWNLLDFVTDRICFDSLTHLDIQHSDGETYTSLNSWLQLAPKIESFGRQGWR